MIYVTPTNGLYLLPIYSVTITKDCKKHPGTKKPSMNLNTRNTEMFGLNEVTDPIRIKNAVDGIKIVLLPKLSANHPRTIPPTIHPRKNIELAKLLNHSFSHTKSNCVVTEYSFFSMYFQSSRFIEHLVLLSFGKVLFNKQTELLSEHFHDGFKPAKYIITT